MNPSNVWLIPLMALVLIMLGMAALAMSAIAIVDSDGPSGRVVGVLWIIFVLVLLPTGRVFGWW